MSPGWMMRSEKLRQLGHVFGPRRDDDVLDVLHARNRVEELHDVRRHLVFGDPRPQELHRLPVRGVADGADDAEAFLLVDVLDGARLHHRRHAVDPVDLRVLERLDHVDVDEVDAELHPGHAALLHLARAMALVNFPTCWRDAGTGRALDPRVRPADVLLGNPRRVALDLEPEVALLEEHRRVVAAEHRVSEPGLQAVPARRQRAGQVADVLVVHAQHRAEAVRLHALASALQPVLPHAIPVDALLPVESRDSEVGSHV